MTQKYGWIYIISLPIHEGVSSSAPVIPAKVNEITRLARRIHVICENENEKEKHLLELQKNLLKQGYPKHLIFNALKRAADIPKEDLRKPKEIESNKNKISTYNPNNPNLFPKINVALNSLINNNAYGSTPRISRLSKQNAKVRISRRFLPS